MALHGSDWVAACVTLPLLGALAGFVMPRAAPLLGILSALGVTVSVTGVAIQVARHGTVVYLVGGWGAPLGIDLQADGLTAVMLVMTAAVGAVVSVYAVSYFHEQQGREARRVAPRPGASISFWPLWLFLWAALNGLYLSADIFNIYVTLELMALSSVALIALGRNGEALVGSMRYLLVSMLGSLSILLAVALLYGRYGRLDLAGLGEVVSPDPTTLAAASLMVLGLALKTALFPLHFWLPPAHANAPTPVSAVLSALVIKGTFYLALRLWFEVFGDLITVPAGTLLGVVGAAAIVWGSLQAMITPRLKLLVAYSTVAQIGYLFLVFPLAHPPAAAATAWQGGVYFALAHGLAKAAMFLAAGTILHSAGHDRIKVLGGVTQLPVSMFAFGLAGMSLLGLPPSGGFVGKWMLLEAALVGRQWFLAVVIVVGGLLAAGYVFRVLAHAMQPAPVAIPPRRVPAIMEWTALALAVAAVLMGLVSQPALAFLRLGAPILFAGAPL